MKDKLEAENKFIKEQLRKYQRTMNRYKEALEQYADEKNWVEVYELSEGKFKEYKCYNVAQEALKGE